MKKTEYTNKKTLGIYIHIPFCRSKCAYCDFYSFPPCGRITDDYVAALETHIARLAPRAAGYTVDSVFIGGGTPTLVGADMIARISAALKANFELDPALEFTVEANPATVDENAMRKMKSAGVNRLSIGLQSVHNNELAALSRIHSYEEFLVAYRDARRAGIDNINIDLMYGIPQQTFASFTETIDTVTQLHPEHISLYGLKIEEGTPFYLKRDELPLPDEDEEYDMYMAAVDFMEKRGYSHYEISNYARDGHESRHNLKYWNGEEYLGIGAAAYSYFDGVRYSYIGNAEDYISAVTSGEEPVDSLEPVSPKESIAEYIMLRLRLGAGINTEEFLRKFGFKFEDEYEEKLKKYIDAGKVKKENGSYILTAEGMYISNMILSDIVEFDS